MLDFRREDGSISESSLYKYLRKHKDDVEVLTILGFPGNSTISKYKNYLTSFTGNDNRVKNEIPTSVQQTMDYETRESSSSIVLDASKIYTEEELLKQHGYDVNKWKIKKHQCSKWQSGTQILMASKIFVKPRDILEGSPKQILSEIDKALGLPTLNIKPIKTSKGNKLLVIPISDLHFGLISDIFTSDNTYNMEIAKDRLFTFVTETINNVKLSEEDTILITFGNDFFNCDNVHGTTVHGTPQDNEASYLTVWDKGVQLGVSVIEFLLKDTKCNIHIASIQGNHDLQSSHAMITALYFNYRYSGRVITHFTSDEKARFYFRYGNNLIGFGHETKIKECHRIMSSECEDWSMYKYRTMFLGHLHKEEVLDTGALVIRRLPILSGKSTWADSQGYMAHPRAQAFVYSAEKGLVNVINVEIL